MHACGRAGTHGVQLGKPEVMQVIGHRAPGPRWTPGTLWSVALRPTRLHGCTAAPTPWAWGPSTSCAVVRVCLMRAYVSACIATLTAHGLGVGHMASKQALAPAPPHPNNTPSTWLSSVSAHAQLARRYAVPLVAHTWNREP